MDRQDRGLAFMLQYENVAWFDGKVVRILDRRVYPTKVEFVTCETHQDVTRAIADMVTQSAGPYTAAPMGMALAAFECRGRSEAAQREYLAAGTNDFVVLDFTVIEENLQCTFDRICTYEAPDNIYHVNYVNGRYQLTDLYSSQIISKQEAMKYKAQWG